MLVFSYDCRGLSPTTSSFRKFVSSPISDKDSRKHLLSLQLWHLLKYAELIEVVRQNDKPFIDMLNKVRVSNVDDAVEELLKASFVCDSDEHCNPKVALHMHAENEPAISRNEPLLNNSAGELYTIEADDKIPDNCKYQLAMILAAQN